MPERVDIMRINVYLLNKNRDIGEYIKETEDHTIYKLSITKSNIEGYFIYQERENELDWISKINNSKWLRGQQLDNVNLTKRGLLLFKLSSDVIPKEKPAIFLISFNGGVNLVKNNYIDYNFGYYIASKLVSQNRIKDYGSTDIHENIVKTNRNSSNNIPTHLIGERLVLSTIESITGYSESNDFFSGSKGLILNYPNEFDIELLQTLEYLYLEYQISEANDTDMYNKMERVKNIEEINVLNKRLCNEIQGIKTKFLSRRRSLEPTDLRSVNISIDFDSGILGYSYTGLNRTKKVYDDIDKIEYFEQLSNYLDTKAPTSENLLKKLKRDKIIAIKDMTDSSNNIEYSIYNSLVFRIPNTIKGNEKVGMLIGGNWYLVNSDYYSALNKRLECKVIRKASELDKFNFICFNKVKHETELKYNDELTTVNNGVLLDQKDYYMNKDLSERKYNGRSKIEPCDVLLYNDSDKRYYFIHNKINNNAQGISHLSTQANISTSLLLDLEASNSFIDFINNQIEEQNSTIPKLKEIRNDSFCVILGIIDKDYDKKLKTIFTILKLQALDNSITRLEQLGVEVKIKLIRDSSS